ncbi:MAG TPA: hypothetical protein VJX23_10900 [Candidatus Binataceae bacterium]|nr:hypothetical protein [Candidatus Binataceae bacterium]
MRKAKPTAVPGTLPSEAIIQQWFLLPLAPPTRREANAGVPAILPAGGFILPEGGKPVLAQIAWTNDDNLQARFVNAGRGNPYRLSRKEYLKLATTGRNGELIDELLTVWAIRAAKREPERAKEGVRLLRFCFTEEFVDFLLARPEEAGRVSRFTPTSDPQEIVRRYLLSEVWKHTCEELTMEGEFSAPRRKGTWNWAEARRRARAEIAAMVEKIKIDHPLQNFSQSTLLEATRDEFKKLGKPQPGRSAFRHALAESKAKP